MVLVLVLPTDYHNAADGSNPQFAFSNHIAMVQLARSKTVFSEIG